MSGLNTCLSALLHQLIEKGVQTVKIMWTGSQVAKIFKLEGERWVFFCDLKHSEVIAALRKATNNAFCPGKLVDRLKLPSASLGNHIGSAVLRYCPPQEHQAAKLVLSGLRNINI